MTSRIPGIPTDDLLRPLRAELGDLVREEVGRALDGYLGKAREGRTGTRMLAGAAVLGSMSAGSATALLIRLLERRPAAAPGVVAAALGAAATALAAAGRRRLRAAWSPAPSGPAGSA
ncbi:phage holin family protein [Geodermatophilus sp. SYSU D00691]